MTCPSAGALLRLLTWVGRFDSRTVRRYPDWSCLVVVCSLYRNIPWSYITSGAPRYNSIPDGVSGIFPWHNLSGRTVALGSTQTLIEINIRNISRRPTRVANNLTTFMCRLSWNLGTSTSWNPQGLSRPVMGLFYRRLALIRCTTSR